MSYTCATDSADLVTILALQSLCPFVIISLSLNFFNDLTQDEGLEDVFL